MELRIKRIEKSDKCTIGKLYVGNDFQCYTLEDVEREVEGKPVKDWKIKGETAIPRGKYNVVVTVSPRFKKRLPRLEGVAGFEGVLIHTGNTAKNTEGCILVGTSKISDVMIGQSQQAFDMLMPKIEAALEHKEKITIEIS